MAGSVLAVGSLTRKYGLIYVLSVFVVLFIVAGTVSGNVAGDQQKLIVVRQVAGQYIEAGQLQFDRGLYMAAEKSFQLAQEYYEYLTDVQREKIDEYLQKTHAAAMEMRRIVANIQEADDLMAADDLEGAKRSLEAIRYNPYLSKGDKFALEQRLDDIDEMIDAQSRKAEKLYSDSVEAYLAGDFAKAKAGFEESLTAGIAEKPEGKKPEDFIARIEMILAKGDVPEVTEPVVVEVTVPDANIAEPVVVEVNSLAPEVADEVAAMQDIAESIDDSESSVVSLAEPADEQQGYIDVIHRRKSVMTSYAHAVVSDAVNEARQAVKEGKFYRAQAVIESARERIQEYRVRLGEELYIQYEQELRDLKQEVEAGRSKWLGDWESKAAWKLEAGD